MKLIDLLKALSVNKQLSVTLIDDTDAELITFNIGGYASVESDLANREVKRIVITSSTTARIIIGDLIQETNTDPGNDPGTDPNDP